jgi:hypothetical protein
LHESFYYTKLTARTAQSTADSSVFDAAASGGLGGTMGANQTRGSSAFGHTAHGGGSSHGGTGLRTFGATRGARGARDSVDTARERERALEQLLRKLNGIDQQGSSGGSALGLTGELDVVGELGIPEPGSNHRSPHKAAQREPRSSRASRASSEVDFSKSINFSEMDPRMVRRMRPSGGAGSGWR